MRPLIQYITVTTLTLLLSACAANYSNATQKSAESSALASFQSPLNTTRAIPRHSSGEPMPFFAEDDAKTDLAATLEKAALSGKKPLVIMGANWCHDSRALAAHFEKSKFVSLLRAHYEPVFIDVGKKDRNVDIANKYGYETIEGTPTVIILSSDGKQILNRITAPTWRDAASRTEREVFNYFRKFAHKDVVE